MCTHVRIVNNIMYTNNKTVIHSNCCINCKCKACERDVWNVTVKNSANQWQMINCKNHNWNKILSFFKDYFKDWLKIYLHISLIVKVNKLSWECHTKKIYLKANLCPKKCWVKNIWIWRKFLGPKKI